MREQLPRAVEQPRLIDAAKRAMDTHGYGMSSVRFICGTQDIHKQLEKAIADYFGTEDTILYAACFDAERRCVRTPLHR
ncbi:MAG: aminotransferase class I/II-fold pyridoxal phosphate-dependent enzyme [Alistipes indistinctus]